MPGGCTINTTTVTTEFINLIRQEGTRLYRDLPWRNTVDPYLILVSEVMLQQTQVKRVNAYWLEWVSTYPTIDALAAASVTDVLESWQGLGYHRRALGLKRTAELCSKHYGGTVPTSYKELLALPGVGPATAAGVCVFAYRQPQVYLETNVRTVFIHHFFNDRERVPDREIIPLVEVCCDAKDPRGWYYALLDYGSFLKSSLPNPSRRSSHYTRQSAFEGSNRQKRAFLLRELLAAPAPAPGRSTEELLAAPAPAPGRSTEELLDALNRFEIHAGRDAVPRKDVEMILAALADEGFIVASDTYGDHWLIAE